ncbi:MAG: glycerophosphodiester phosphodiesterase family protein [Bacteroidota bacterium]
MLSIAHSAPPLVIAHRGSSGLAPENTLASFRRAVEEGAHMVELDVRMTRDFFLVVYHDPDIRRTTNGEGTIWEYSLQELRAFDAGAWFDLRFKGERIPTLRQVMELLPPGVDLNIEVKTDGDPRTKLAFEEACILAVMEKRLEARTLVSSFDHAYLKRFHHLFPSIATAALVLPDVGAGHLPSRLAASLGVRAFISPLSGLTPHLVEDAHTHGLPVACYTVNTPKDLGRARSLGVDAVITDFPGRMAELVAAP